jgi:hypothetical protein
MPLKDTLNRLREQEKQEKQDRPALIAGWRAAVDALLTQIRSHLSEYEQDGSLVIKQRGMRLTEENLGAYEISAMDIQAGPILLLVQPVGLMVPGAEGRVDMHRQGRPSEERRIMLLLMRPSGATSMPVWFITLPRDTTGFQTQVYATPTPTRRVEPLTKEALEQAIDFLLK